MWRRVKNRRLLSKHITLLLVFFVNDNDPVPVNFLENVGEIYFIMKIIGFACKLESCYVTCFVLRILAG